jgi:Macrocin-O-methyltransferase (TylF)
MRVLSYSKYLLTILGSYCSKRNLLQIQAGLNYLKIGHWIAEHGFQIVRRARDRKAVFDYVASKVQNKKVLYLEFGVYRGDSILYWARKLRNPDTKLHGFDSFEGLPEGWGPHAKGHFGVAGKVPQIDDPRITFFKGWFDQTLPRYSVPPHEILVIVMDADLYSSTIYVLRHLRPYIQSGTFIYFDEMNQIDHEPKALDEFINECSLEFRPVCADLTLSAIFFECCGPRLTNQHQNPYSFRKSFDYNAASQAGNECC